MSTKISINEIARAVDLNCPVCKEIPRGEIVQCKNGHIVCISCDNQLTCCPLCRSSRRRHGRIRNKKLEQVLDLFKFGCDFKIFGCEKQFTRQELHEHQESCKYGKVNVKASRKRSRKRKKGKKQRKRSESKRRSVRIMSAKPKMRSVRAKSITDRENTS